MKGLLPEEAGEIGNSLLVLPEQPIAVSQQFCFGLPCFGSLQFVSPKVKARAPVVHDFSV